MRIVAVALVVMLLAGGLAAPPARAEEPAKPPTLADLTLGEPWGGAAVGQEDLVGKVVLFILWGS